MLRTDLSFVDCDKFYDSRETMKSGCARLIGELAYSGLVVSSLYCAFQRELTHREYYHQIHFGISDFLQLLKKSGFFQILRQLEHYDI